MRAVAYDAVGALPGLVDIPEPDCPPDGVVVRVAATGLCRSDWHAWQGSEPVALPHVPGHEYAGTIAAVGPGVSRLEVGDRVTVPFVLGCGVCDYCRRGDAQVCPDQRQPGFTLPGSFAELVAVPRADTNVVVLPDAVSMAAAASLGCRFATAYRAVVAHGQVEADQWVAVHGCGGVGLSAVMVAKALGARVVAVDVRVGALEAATDLGADVVLASHDPGTLATSLREITGGGPHVGLDAIGHPDVAHASVASLRPRGRHVQVGLLVGEHARSALPMDLVVGRELVVLGSHGMPAVDYPGMLGLVESGSLDPERLVTRTIGLGEAGEALAAMSDASRPGITLIDPARGVR